ncbi:MAG: hypothetical protein JWP45_2193 [Mucilaginibacter sp.]|jgi:hypothetical protein|nr:hypothetical protein [Mucilaginibacter sp.]
MKKIELSAKSLASLDLAIKQKTANFDITGDDVCQYIENVLDVLEITEIFAAEAFSEKLNKAVAGVLKGASVDELIKIREGAVKKG